MLYALLTAMIGLNTLRRPSWFAVFTFFAAIGLVAFNIYRVLGTPIPAAWTQTKDATILGSYVDEPKAIYVWIMPTGGSVPVSVKFPFSYGLGDSLADAAQLTKQEGGVSKLGGGGGRGSPMAYNSPITALPPKTK